MKKSLTTEDTGQTSQFKPRRNPGVSVCLRQTYYRKKRSKHQTKTVIELRVPWCTPVVLFCVLGSSMLALVTWGDSVFKTNKNLQMEENTTREKNPSNLDLDLDATGEQKNMQ